MESEVRTLEKILEGAVFTSGTAKKLYDQGRYKDLYVLARYMYRVGEPIMSDALYERLQTELTPSHEIDVFLAQSYDDDDVPVEILESLGMKPIYTVKVEGRKELYEYLNEDKSFSIQSVTSPEEAYPFFMMLRNEQLDFILSTKIDGVNTKMLYENGEFALSLSRGRNGDSFDYTDNSANVMPQFITKKDGLVRVTGESYVVDEGLPILREKYKKPEGYVSGKSAAISLLRVAHSRDMYQYLRTRVFYAEGLSDTLAGTFSALHEMGIGVPPYMILSWEMIPTDEKEFADFINRAMDVIWEHSKEMPSDGVVVEVNDLNWLGEQHNQYVNRQLALKFGHWGYACYEGVITDIRIEQKRVNKSVRIVIEPVVTRDGNKATVINSFNPSYIIDNDLTIGKKIWFERNSEAANVLIAGERLEQLKQAGIIRED